MLGKLITITFLLVLGIVTYDISLSGNFQKSQCYKYLDEVRALQYGTEVLHEVKKSLNKASSWGEKNIPAYYSEACTLTKPYIELSYNLFLVLKGNLISLQHHLFVYINKNFPTLQNSANEMFAVSIKMAGESLELLSNKLQNYTAKAIDYANDMIGSTIT